MNIPAYRERHPVLMSRARVAEHEATRRGECASQDDELLLVEDDQLQARLTTKLTIRTLVALLLEDRFHLKALRR